MTDPELPTGLRIELNKHVKVREEKRGTVIFDTVNERVYIANETGGRALKLLLSGKTVDESVKSLSEEYKCDGDTVKSDVSSLIKELISKSLVVGAQSAEMQ